MSHGWRLCSPAVALLHQVLSQQPPQRNPGNQSAPPFQFLGPRTATQESALYFLCAPIKLLGHEPWGFQLDFDAIAVGDGALLLKNARSCAEALVASF